MYVQAGYHIILILVQEIHAYVRQHTEIRKNSLKNFNHQETDLPLLTCFVLNYAYMTTSIESIQNSRLLLLNNHRSFFKSWQQIE
jgi:hypothetical protein